MDTQKCKGLHGENNARLGKTNEQDNEGTAAWADEKKAKEKSQVAVPGESAVVNAKEWVDNGSRL
ncbi:MAG: DUF3787 domain-containing protein [Lachnospira sp.]|nr:DUF3787 domain-containing protein [Lachnospira sp.]